MDETKRLYLSLTLFVGPLIMWTNWEPSLSWGPASVGGGTNLNRQNIEISPGIRTHNGTTYKIKKNYNLNISDNLSNFPHKSNNNREIVRKSLYDTSL
ncbi:hypothetical protein YC2023_026253 [Brassica napus]